MGLFFRLNSCCCGFSLRTGSLIIGWLQLLSTILAFILILCLALPQHSVCDNIPFISENPNNITYISYDDSSVDNVLNNEENYVEYLARKTPMHLIIFLSLVFVLAIIPNILLLLGVYLNNSKCVMIWIVSYAVLVAVYFINNVIGAGYVFYVQGYALGAFILFKGLFATVLEWYLLSVVHSHYEETLYAKFNS